MEGGSFTRDSEGEICKMPFRRASLFIGALLENLEGVVCRDFCETRKVYLGFFLDPQAIKILSLGAIWNCGKGTGLS
jgi:hypothetical protein